MINVRRIKKINSLDIEVGSFWYHRLAGESDNVECPLLCLLNYRKLIYDFTLLTKLWREFSVTAREYRWIFFHHQLKILAAYRPHRFGYFSSWNIKLPTEEKYDTLMRWIIPLDHSPTRLRHFLPFSPRKIRFFFTEEEKYRFLWRSSHIPCHKWAKNSRC